MASYKTVFLLFRLLGTDGRNVNDIYRFTGQNSRLDIAKLSLESGHIAPTAPDTLGERIKTPLTYFICYNCFVLHSSWIKLQVYCSNNLTSFSGSYPYYDKDPFIIKECPNVYFVGNQPEFAQDIVTG